MERIVTKPSRIVKGNPTDIQNKEKDDGTEYQEYYFAIALDKNDPATKAIIKKIDDIAKNANPQKPFDSLSLKYTDGDSTIPNNNNKVPCEQEGYPGNYVIHLRSPWCISLFDKDNKVVDISKPEQKQLFNCGNYIKVAFDIAPNSAPKGKHGGVYLNPRMAKFAYYGESISSFIADPTEFDSASDDMPIGASTTPLEASIPDNFGHAESIPDVEPLDEFLDAPELLGYIIKGKKYTLEALKAKNVTDEKLKAAGAEPYYADSDIPF